MRTEAESGRDTATSQGISGASKTGRGEEGSSPKAIRGHDPNGHLDFALLASTTVKEYIYVVFSYKGHASLTEALTQGFQQAWVLAPRSSTPAWPKEET